MASGIIQEVFVMSNPSQMAPVPAPAGDATVKVWDPLVRLFHWSLVAAFALAYVTEDDWLGVHTLAGYTVLGLVVFRVLWGAVGTRHARFASFVRAPRVVLAYLRDMLRGRERRYLGHNPAGGAMILALLAALMLTGVTGLALYGIEPGAGPLAGWLAGAGHGWEEFFEEAHELLANVTLVLIGLHVAGVILAGLRHGENLVRSMVTGRKRAGTR